MERQEPTLGAPAELADLEFRQRPHRPAPTKEPLGLEWKIAIGVFLGLSMFGLATCVSMAVIGSAVQQEQQKQVDAAIADLNRAMRDPDPFGWQAAARKQERETQRREAEYYALRPGERCIGGKRFRRVDNGWVQINRPCR